MSARADHLRILHAELRSALHLGAAAARTTVGFKPAPGQNTRQALSHLRSIHGLVDVTVDVNKITKTASVHVTVDQGHTVTDHVALLTFLVRTIWSLNEDRPEILTVFVDSEQGFDVLAAAAGWPGAFGDETIVMIPAVDADQMLGAWPGRVHYLADSVLDAG